MNGQQARLRYGAYRERSLSFADEARDLPLWNRERAEWLHGYLGTLIQQGRSGSRRRSQRRVREILREVRLGLARRFHFPAGHPCQRT